MAWSVSIVCVLALALICGLQVNAVRVRRSNHVSNICSIWGNYHFKTFDGDYFQFQGTCEYNLVSDCHGPAQSFSVHIKRTENTLNPLITRLMVVVGDLTIGLTKGLAIVNNEIVKLPHYESGVMLEENPVYIKLTAKLGLTVTWDKHDAVMVELDNKYLNHTCGLCGDYNGMPVYNELISDDRLTGYIEFGNKHRIHIPNDLCEDPPEQAGSEEDLTEMCQHFLDDCSKLLMDEGWSSCRSILTPEPYINACVKDRCQGHPGDIEDTVSLCSTMSEYSRQCSHAGGTPPNWRTPTFCEVKCPFNMEYSESGSPCLDTCSHRDTSSLCEEHKMDGCFCPPGTVYDDISERGCIPKETCQCKHDKVYNPGEVLYKSDEECVCKQEGWICKRLPVPGVCAMEEGSHFTTFDGKEFTFHGDCYYILSQDCVDSKFTILVQLMPCIAQHTDTCLRSLVFLLNNDKNNGLIIKDDGTVRHNGDITLPYNTVEFTIFRPSSFHIMLQTTFGLQIQVQLVPLMQVYITLKDSFHNKTCGLCGNFNMVLSDELKTPQGVVEGTATSFGNSWTAHSNCPNQNERLDDPCSYSVDSESYAEHWCSKLRETESVFAKCHSTVNPENYYKRCKYSSCTCQKSEDCLCAVFSSYVRACAAKGVFLQGWRDTVCEKYSQSCPASQTFVYKIQKCQSTCDSLSLERQQCSIDYVPVDGCTCPEGLYENENGACVPMNKCSCYHSGQYIEAGKSINIKNEHCVCADGKLICQSWKRHVTECSAPKVFFNCSAVGPDQHGLECAQTCAQNDVACYLTECESGCQCPKGLLDDGRGYCVEKHNCPCKHNGHFYAPGSQITDQCNTCICKRGKWDCTKHKCPGTCTIYGSGHYNTFDKRLYGFSGDCSYIAVQDKCGNKKGTFNVITENVPCGTTGTTCSKAIRILLGKTELELRDGQVTEIEATTGQHIKFTKRRAGLYWVIESEIGLTVLWDRKMTVRIILQPQHMGNVCGLCGNFNGNGKDDFTTQGLLHVSDVLEFVNSWKALSVCPNAKPDFNPCFKTPNRHAWAKLQCSIIKSETFKDCHRKVDWGPYFDNCVKDACSCNSGGDCECFCSAVASYAQACNEAGVCVAWRTPEICPVFCDYYNHEFNCTWHYSPCHTPCYKTCLNPEGKCINPLPHLEGCYPKCPEDKPIYDEKNDLCVEKCEGCLINGTDYTPGQEIETEIPCQKCYCGKNGSVICHPRPGCCFYNGKEYNENDVIYDLTDNMGTCYYAICINSTVINASYPCPSTTAPTVTPTPTITISEKTTPETTPPTTTIKITTTTEATSTTVKEPTTSPCIICEWSDWFNVYHPATGGGSDLETYENIKNSGKEICDRPEDIQCRSVNTSEISFDEFTEMTGQVVKCNVSFGLVCEKEKQKVRPYKCFDYKIKVLCCKECATSTTTPVSSTTPTVSTVTTTTPTTTPVVTSESTTFPSTVTTTPTTKPTTTSVSTTESTTFPSTVTTTPTTKPTTTLVVTSESTTFPSTVTTTPPVSSTTPTVSTVTTTKPTTTSVVTTESTTFPSTVTTTPPVSSTTPTTPKGSTVTATKPTTTSVVTTESTTLPTKVTTTPPVSSTTPTVSTVTTPKPTSTSVVTTESTTFPSTVTTTPTTKPTTTPVFTSESTTFPSTVTTPPVSSTTPTVSTVTTTKPTTTSVVTTETTSTTVKETATTSPCIICEWSDWFNVYDPITGGGSDLETYENIKNSGKEICDRPEDIQCRGVNTSEISFDEFTEMTGQVVKCNVSFGLVCEKEKQKVRPYKCLNYEIKVLCCKECAISTTTPVSSTTPTVSTVTTTTPTTTPVATTESTTFPSTVTTTPTTKPTTTSVVTTESTTFPSTVTTTPVSSTTPTVSTVTTTKPTTTSVVTTESTTFPSTVTTTPPVSSTTPTTPKGSTVTATKTTTTSQVTTESTTFPSTVTTTPTTKPTTTSVVTTESTTFPSTVTTTPPVSSTTPTVSTVTTTKPTTTSVVTTESTTFPSTVTTTPPVSSTTPTTSKGSTATATKPTTSSVVTTESTTLPTTVTTTPPVSSTTPTVSTVTTPKPTSTSVVTTESTTLPTTVTTTPPVSSTTPTVSTVTTPKPTSTSVVTTESTTFPSTVTTTPTNKPTTTSVVTTESTTFPSIVTTTPPVSITTPTVSTVTTTKPTTTSVVTTESTTFPSTVTTTPPVSSTTPTTPKGSTVTATKPTTTSVFTTESTTLPTTVTTTPPVSSTTPTVSTVTTPKPTSTSVVTTESTTFPSTVTTTPTTKPTTTSVVTTESTTFPSIVTTTPPVSSTTPTVSTVTTTKPTTTSVVTTESTTFPSTVTTTPPVSSTTPTTPKGSTVTATKPTTTSVVTTESTTFPSTVTTTPTTKPTTTSVVTTESTTLPSTVTTTPPVASTTPTVSTVTTPKPTTTSVVTTKSTTFPSTVTTTPPVSSTTPTTPKGSTVTTTKPTTTLEFTTKSTTFPSTVTTPTTKPRTTPVITTESTTSQQTVTPASSTTAESRTTSIHIFTGSNPTSMPQVLNTTATSTTVITESTPVTTTPPVASTTPTVSTVTTPKPTTTSVVTTESTTFPSTVTTPPVSSTTPKGSTVTTTKPTTTLEFTTKSTAFPSTVTTPTTKPRTTPVITTESTTSQQTVTPASSTTAESRTTSIHIFTGSNPTSMPQVLNTTATSTTVITESTPVTTTPPVASTTPTVSTVTTPKPTTTSVVTTESTTFPSTVTTTPPVSSTTPTTPKGSTVTTTKPTTTLEFTTKSTTFPSTVTTPTTKPRTTPVITTESTTSQQTVTPASSTTAESRTTSIHIFTGSNPTSMPQVLNTTATSTTVITESTPVTTTPPVASTTPTVSTVTTPKPTTTSVVTTESTTFPSTVTTTPPVSSTTPTTPKGSTVTTTKPTTTLEVTTKSTTFPSTVTTPTTKPRTTPVITTESTTSQQTVTPASSTTAESRTTSIHIFTGSNPTSMPQVLNTTATSTTVITESTPVTSTAPVLTTTSKGSTTKTETTFTTGQTTKPTTTPTSTTECFCIINGTHYRPGQVIITDKHIGSNICLTMLCLDSCIIQNITEICPTTTPTPTPTPTPSPTPPPKNCSEWGVTENEIFEICNCTLARCIENNTIEIVPYVCPPLKNITCSNLKPPVLVPDEYYCCYERACDCFCEGWGDPHYITFDGLLYSYQGECTYVLMEEIRPKHHLKIYIDNVNCDPREAVSCPRAIIVSYNSLVITLKNHNLIGAAKLEALQGHSPLKLPFYQRGLSVVSSGLNLILEIPQLKVVVMFGITGFSVNLPFQHFGNNTQGHCGTCNNNIHDDCMLPDGTLADNCAIMANYWEAKDLFTPECKKAPTAAPPEPDCPKNTLCDLMNGDLFKECHPHLPPNNYITGCQFDSCHMSNPAVVCTSLQTYAAACSQLGICINWRNHAELCAVSCPANKVYQACGPANPPTCKDKPEDHVLNVTTEGCFCPDGMQLFSKESDVCVHKCGCLDPSGQGREFGETFEYGCQDCVCEEASASVICKPRQCSNHNNLLTCNDPGFIVVNMTDPSDACCTILTCRCESSTCPSTNNKCSVGYTPVLNVPEGKCCPELTCEPKKVCVHKGLEYEPSTTTPVVDCQECVCTTSVDPYTQLYKIQCGFVTCNETCEPGYEYKESMTSECCGKCEKTKCVVNYDGKVHIMEPGTEWIPNNACDKFVCTKINGEYVATNYKVQCPPFDSANCQPGTMQFSANHCCQVCVEKDKGCRVQTTVDYLTHGICRSVVKVDLTHCGGHCNSYSKYTELGSSSCSCCQASRTSNRTVNMECLNGEFLAHSYFHVEACSCDQTKCLSDLLDLQHP